MPKISIIVPVYKVEKYINKCIDSILEQEYKDFELILIDDGSPDSCGEICDQYSLKDGRVRVLHIDNSGVSVARNKGLDIAEGEYIAFVDSDDWIQRDMFLEMINVAERTHTDVVICGFKYWDEKKRYSREGCIYEKKYDNIELLMDIYGMPRITGGGVWNKLFRSSIIKDIRFKSDVKIEEDVMFLFDCYSKCENGIQIPQALYVIREREGSATRTNDVNYLFESIKGGKQLKEMLMKARNHSSEIEKVGTDKYLDDCLRYSNQIQEIGKTNGQPYLAKCIKIRLQMLSVFPRIFIKRLLPKEKIHSYLYELIFGL